MRWIIFVLTMFYTAELCAAPTINDVVISGGGAANDGASITITGNAFGLHNLDIHWLGGKDGVIENTVAGQKPDNGDGWIFFDWNVDAAVSTDQAHSGNKSFYIPLASSGFYTGVIRYGHSSAIGYNQDVFISWWTRRVHVGNGQWKIFRVCYRNSVVDLSTPQFKTFDWYNSNQFFVAAGPGTNATDYSYDMPFPSADNRWYRVDVYVQTSSGHGVNDGFMSWTRHDPTGGSISTGSISNIMMFNDDNDYYQWFLWQNYIGNGLTSSTVWIDDPYVQVGTQARVELGDNSDYYSCSFREIQRPDSWTEGKITLSLNRGSFQNGDAAYLFVVDAAGNPSNSFQITIGESSVAIPSPYCGDGTLDTGEECDDGNIVSGDGCAADCTVEVQAGNLTWDATVQFNNTNWLDSSVTYSVRLLVEGGNITNSGNLVQLSFIGRTSGDYTIRKVSIAERDIAGAEGDVVDSTWTRVTFDGESVDTWGTSVITVNANQKKNSNAVPFNLQAGTDYYVTFKIDTPSIYLEPPASYRELYFLSADHTDDIDWSGNGYSVTQDYHALSSIVAINSPQNIGIKP